MSELSDLSGLSEAIQVSIRSRELRWRGRTWSCRSEAPFRFLGLLWWRAHQAAVSPWVSLAEVGQVLGVSTHGKQMARILDFIEQLTEIRLVDYKTRTRGQYRLACPPSQISLDIPPEALDRWLGLPQESHPPAPATLSPQKVDDLLDTLQAVLSADSLLHDGSLEKAAKMLDGTMAAGAGDSPWRGTLLCRRASVALRQGNNGQFRALLSALRDTQRDSRFPDPFAHLTAQLLAVKAQYDRNCLEEAERLLLEVDVSRCQDRWLLGRYFNLRGLVRFRCWNQDCAAGTASGTDPGNAVQEIFDHYCQALRLQIAVCDYQGVQATAFNLANVLLTPTLLGIEHPSRRAWLEQGLASLGICQQACTDFAVGMDSVWSHVLFLEVALATGMEFTELKRLSGGLMGSNSSLEEAFRHVQEIAEQLGNPKEIDTVRELWKRYRQAAKRNDTEKGMRDGGTQQWQKVGPADLAGLRVGHGLVGSVRLGTGECD